MSTADRAVKKVLIVGDAARVLRTPMRCLRAPHLNIVTWSEIEAAECLMDSERFDALVTDFEVPNLGGLEGMRLIQHAMVRFPKLAVFVLGGKLTREVGDLGRALGVTGVLERPGDLARLRHLIALVSIGRNDWARTTGLGPAR